MLVKYVDPEDSGVVLVVDVEDTRSRGYSAATSARDKLEDLADVAGMSIEQALAPVVALARAARRRVNGLDSAERPAAMTIETGVELGGEVGVVCFKGSAKATLQITLRWDFVDGNSPRE